MVDRVIRVVVDPSGARTGLQQVDRSAQQTSRSLGGVKTAALAIVAALGVRELIQYADTFTLINNRIKLVTDSQEEQNAVQRELIQLANETRSPLENTVELYARVARATEELGTSQREVIDLTRAVNQAIQISGATAIEAGAGVIQFAQGLASGALRGDELRSVLEQTPRLARALADGLKVGIGELRELGATGQLTAEKVIGALAAVADDLQSEFDQLTPTIEASLTVLNNETLTLVGSLDQALGISRSFGMVIIDLGGAIGNLTEDVVLFGLALKLSISERIAEVVAEFSTLDERFELFSNTLAGVFATIIGDEETAALLAQQRLLIDRELTSAEDDANARLEQIRASLREQASRDVIEFITRPDVDLERERGGEDGRPAKRTAEQKEAQDDAEKLLATLMKQTMELAAQNTFGEAADQILRRNAIEELKRTGATIETVNALRSINTELALQEDIQEEIANAMQDADVISGLQEELALLQAEGDERLRILALQQLSVDATDEQIAATEKLIEAIEKETEKSKMQLITIEEIDKEFTRGVAAAFTNFFTNVDEGFDGLRTAFSQLLTDLAAQILTNIIITQFLNALPGGGIVGSVVNAFGGAQGTQFGGPALPGVPQIVGEGNRPEVFIPSQAGRVEPLAAFGGETTVVVINEQDPKALVATLNSQDGVRVQRNFVQVEQRLVKRTLGLR